MSKAAVIIVTWNSERNLRLTLESLNNQTWKDFDVLVVDNASSDSTVDIVRSERPTAMLLRNIKNLGYGRAFNQAIAYVTAHLAQGSPNYLLASLSPGVVLDPDCFRYLMDVIDRQPDIGSVTGPLYRAWRDWGDETGQMIFSDVVEAAGLSLLRSGRVVERDSGAEDNGRRYGVREEVFGVPGSFGVYRFGALGEATIGSSLMDESYLMGQEHEDLAWRLRILGWPAQLVPQAKAWRIGERAEAGKGVTLVHDLRRSAPSAVLTQKAFGNQVITTVRNVHLLNSILDWPWQASSMVGRSAYLFFRRPRAWRRAWSDVFRAAPKTLVYRFKLRRRAHVKSGQLRSWYTKGKKD